MKPKIYITVFLILAFFYLDLNGQSNEIKNYGIGDTLVIGVFEYTGEKKEIEVTFSKFANYLGDKLDLPSRVEVFKEQFTATLLKGKIDIAVYNPDEYLTASKHEPHIRAFASHKAYEAKEYTCVILARKDSGINKLEDFKGKNFYFGKSTSTSGYKIPLNIFKKAGITQDMFSSFFKNGDYPHIDMGNGKEGSHQDCLAALKDKKADGIATYKEVYEYEYKKNKLIDLNDVKIIAEEKIPYNAYVFSPKIEKEGMEKIKNFMFKAADIDKRGVQTQRIFWDKSRLKTDSAAYQLGIQSWFPVNDNHYNDLRYTIVGVRLKPLVNVTSKLDGKKTNSILNEFESSGRFLINNLLKNERNRIAEFDIEIDGEKLKISDNYGVYPKQFETYLLKGSSNPEQILENILNSSFFQLKKLEVVSSNTEGSARVLFGANDGLKHNSYDFFIADNQGKRYKITPEIKDQYTDFKLPKKIGEFEVLSNYTVEIRYMAQTKVPNWTWLYFILGISSFLFTIFGVYLLKKKRKQSKIYFNVLRQVNRMSINLIEKKLSNNEILLYRLKVKGLEKSDDLNDLQVNKLNKYLGEIERLNNRQEFILDKTTIDQSAKNSVKGLENELKLRIKKIKAQISSYNM